MRESGCASTETCRRSNSEKRWKAIRNSAIFRRNGSNNCAINCSTSTTCRQRSNNKC